MELDLQTGYVNVVRGEERRGKEGKGKERRGGELLRWSWAGKRAM